MHPGWPQSYMKAQAYVVHMMKIRIMHSLHVASASHGHGGGSVHVYEKPSRCVRAIWVPQQRRTRARPQHIDDEGKNSEGRRH